MARCKQLGRLILLAMSLYGDINNDNILESALKIKSWVKILFFNLVKNVYKNAF